MNKRCLLGGWRAARSPPPWPSPSWACRRPRPRQRQGFPERAVRIIVPTAPGGSIDTTARVVAGKLAEL